MTLLFAFKTSLEKEISLLIAIAGHFYTSAEQLENIRWQEKLRLLCFTALPENNACYCVLGRT